MALWFGLLIALGGVNGARAAAPEFRPNLLSYAEVMRLSPAARATYLNDVSDLLVEMEDKLVLKNEYANRDASDRRPAQVALIMQLMGGMPYADADDEAAVDPTLATPDEAAEIAAIKPRWTGTGYTCGNDQKAVFDPSVATCVLPATKSFYGLPQASLEWKGNCPFGSKRFVVKRMFGNTAKCVPDASFEALGQDAKNRLMGGKFYSPQKYEQLNPEDKQKLTGVPPVEEPVPQSAAGGGGGNGAAPSESRPGAEPTTQMAAAGVNGPKGPDGASHGAAAGGSAAEPAAQAPASANATAPTPGCAVKPKKCGKMTNAQRQQALIDFRKDPAAKMCVAGGFFTKKDSTRAAATCETVKRFPATGDAALKCDKPNEVLCNPVVFCLQFVGVKYQAKGQAKTADLPVGVCVKNGPHITRACRTELKANLAGKINFDGLDKSMDDARTKKPKRCDPTKVKWPVGLPFMEEYKKLRAETENNYFKYCLNEKSGMLPLFCRECEIIGQSFRHVVAKAGHACGGAGDGTAPETTPNPGATPEAPTGGDPKIAR